MVRPRVASKSPSGRRFTEAEMQAAVAQAVREEKLEAENKALRSAQWCSGSGVSCTNALLVLVLALGVAAVLYFQGGRLVDTVTAAGLNLADDMRGYAGLGRVREATGAFEPTNFTARAYSGDGTSIDLEFPDITAPTPAPSAFSAPRAASNSSGGGGEGTRAASAGAGTAGSGARSSTLGRGGGGGGGAGGGDSSPAASASAGAGAGARSSSPVGRGGGGSGSGSSGGGSSGREGRDSDGRGATADGKLIAQLSVHKWVPELAGAKISSFGARETTVIRNYCEYVVARANLAFPAFGYEVMANTFLKSAMDTCPPGSRCDVLNGAIRETLPGGLSELDKAVEVNRVRRVCGSPVMLPSYTSGKSVVMDLASYARLAGIVADTTLNQFTTSKEYASLSSAAASVLGAFTKTVGLGGGSLLTNEQIEMRLSELAALPPRQLEAYLTSARARLEAGLDASTVQSVTSVLAYMLNNCSEGADAGAGEYSAGAKKAASALALADEEEIPELEPVESSESLLRSLALSGGGRGGRGGRRTAGKGRAPRLSLWGGGLYSAPRLVGGSMRLYAAPRLVGGGGSARRDSSEQQGTAPTVAQQAVAMNSMKQFYNHMSSSGMCGSPILRFCISLLAGIGTLLLMKLWTPMVVWESIATLLWNYQNPSAPLPKSWDWLTMIGQFQAGVESTSTNDTMLKQIVHSIYIVLTWIYTQVQLAFVSFQFRFSLTGTFSSDDIHKAISLIAMGKWSLSLFLWLFKVVGMGMMHLGDFFCKVLTTGTALSLELMFKSLHLPMLGQRLRVVACTSWMGKEEGEKLMQFYEGINARQQQELLAMAARRAAEDMAPLAATLGISPAVKKTLDTKLAAEAVANKVAAEAVATKAEAKPAARKPPKKAASPKKGSPKKSSPKKSSPKKASPKRRAKNASPARRRA